MKNLILLFILLYCVNLSAQVVTPSTYWLTKSRLKIGLKPDTTSIVLGTDSTLQFQDNKFSLKDGKFAKLNDKNVSLVEPHHHYIFAWDSVANEYTWANFGTIAQDTARYAVNLMGGGAKKIPYQFSADSTLFIDAPSGTGIKSLVYDSTLAAFKWMPVIDTTKIPYLAKSNSFTNKNSFRDSVSFRKDTYFYGANRFAGNVNWFDYGIVNFGNSSVNGSVRIFNSSFGYYTEFASGAVTGNITLTAPIVSGTLALTSIAGGGTNATTFTTGKYIFFDGTRLKSSGKDSLSFVGKADSLAITGYATQYDILSKITLTSLSASSPLSYNNGSGAFSIADAVADATTKGAASFTTNDFNSASGNISLDYTNGQKASTSQPGFLSTTDWDTFNGKQAALTTGNLTESITGLQFDNTRQVIGGAATLSLSAGYVIPTTTEQTNWGTAYTNTHTHSNKAILDSNTVAFTLAKLGQYNLAYARSSKLVADSTNWNTAYTNRIATFTTTGSSGSATFSSNTLNIPTYTLAGLGGTISPATNTDGYIPLWDGTNSKTLKNGLAYTSVATASTIVSRDGSANSYFSNTYNSNNSYVGTANSISGATYYYGANSSYTQHISSADLTASRYATLPNTSGTLLIDGGSYSNPTWLASIDAGKLSGTISNYRLPTTVARRDTINVFTGSANYFREGLQIGYPGSYIGTAYFYDGVAGNKYVAISGDVTLSSSRVIYLPDANGTFALGTGTANQIAYWSGTNTLGTLSTGTYPSLTELSYVKGVTSAIQTQMNTKVAYAYGELYDNTGASTITTDNTNYVKWTNATVGAYSGVIGSMANDNLTIDTGKDGTYRVEYSVSFNAEDDGDYYWTVNVAGSPLNKMRQKVTATALVTYNVSGTALVALSATNTIDLGCFGGASNVVNVTYVNVNITKVSN